MWTQYLGLAWLGRRVGCCSDDLGATYASPERRSSCVYWARSCSDQYAMSVHGLRRSPFQVPPATVQLTAKTPGRQGCDESGRLKFVLSCRAYTFARFSPDAICKAKRSGTPKPGSVLCMTRAWRIVRLWPYCAGGRGRAVAALLDRATTLQRLTI